MDHTKTDATNQRIERITPQHMVVGIDIAKDMHVAQVMNYRSQTLTKRHLSFSNTQEGFEKLLDWMKRVDKSQIIVGMEPTGHYWFNLANWLLEQHIEVVLVNPVATHRNKENRDNSPSKNDSKDAITIADLITRGCYTDYAPHAPLFDQIKTQMSDREYWAKLATSVGNRIVRWIDLYFPEFRQVFREWNGERALATLRFCPLPADLKNLEVDTLIAGWREHGMKRAGGVSGKAKAAELHRIAGRSIGKAWSANEARQDIQRLLETHAMIESMLAVIQGEVESLLDQVPQAKQLRSIGLGTITIASLLACAGDLRRYAHGRQLLRRAGLNLAERTSGKHRGQIKLSKRGDGTLRKYLYLAMLHLVGQHPDFKAWHARNQRKGMAKMKSLFKLLGKLARIVIGLIQRGELYQSSAHEGVAA